jgi:hypothetical protein
MQGTAPGPNKGVQPRRSDKDRPVSFALPKIETAEAIQIPFRGGVVLIHPKDPCIQQYIGN